MLECQVVRLGEAAKAAAVDRDTAMEELLAAHTQEVAALQDERQDLL